MLTCVSVGKINVKMETQGTVMKTRKTQGIDLINVTYFDNIHYYIVLM